MLPLDNYDRYRRKLICEVSETDIHQPNVQIQISR